MSSSNCVHTQRWEGRDAVHAHLVIVIFILVALSGVVRGEMRGRMERFNMRQ
jgi:hypothetical protein